MPIVPDTADWTWVLERPCPQCRFDAAVVSWDDLADLVDRLSSAWSSLLVGRPPGVLRTRPSDDCWSALEYACHVRDVLVRFTARFEAMLSDDGPRFANWDQDRTAVDDAYAEQDPHAVSTQILRAGPALAALLRTVRSDQLSRVGHRSDGATFTVESLGRYMVHDPIHHLHDVSEPFAVGL